MKGHTGKILRINLTEKSTSVIPTKKYENWYGGHGMGSAIFWDLVKDKNISGFDPANVVTIMTSPLTGTLAPAASARTEVQGIGVQSSPVGWFTRSNLGGRFGAMLKYAGWDGIVIEGKAAAPVWIDIRNDEVKITDAGKLWGKDTYDTQKIIWKEVSGKNTIKDWFRVKSKKTGSRTTQKPAVLTIGPAGENLGRTGCLIHDAGNAAGQGGFGGVWGSKNLKAISVIGTGGVKIAMPDALIKARLWSKERVINIDDPEEMEKLDTLNPMGTGNFSVPALPVVFWQRPEQSRPQSCTGCHAGCRSRYDSGTGNESHCVDTAFYSSYDTQRHSGIFVKALALIAESLGQNSLAVNIYNLLGKQTPAAYRATDLAQRYGINAYELAKGIPYLRALNKMEVLGRGKEIDCDLPFDKFGSFEFIEKLVNMISYRKGKGDDMAEGFYRAAKRWGRIEEDLKSGILEYPYWGLPEHNYDPRAEIEWGYGSILGDRDINEHCFNILFWMPSISRWQLKDPSIPAAEIVKIFTEKMEPYNGDEMMLDFSTENMYSDHIAKLVSWHRHYTRFWKQSILFCDFRFPDFFSNIAKDKRGITGTGEPKFLNSVTGKDISFEEGVELGRKIWNLDNAIWTLQGRHRNMVHFSEYIYKEPFAGILGGGSLAMYYMPGKVNGDWDYIPLDGRHIEKIKFEEWKTKFYKLEGWDPATGWPTRETLESIGLKNIADELEQKGRIGASSVKKEI